MNQTSPGWRKRQIALDNQTQGEEYMKEEWLFPNAIVPVDVETTSKLIAEIKRLIGVIGGMALAQSEQDTIYRLSALVRAQQITIDKLEAQPEQKPVASNCKHEWADDTKDKPAWRCIKCGENYKKANT